MKVKLLFLFSFFLVAFTSCRTTRTDAPMPEKGVIKPFPKELSTINIPVRINLKELENKINQLYQGVLYEDNSFENNDNDNLILKITKLDNFTITGLGDQFQINAPIEIYVKGRVKKDFFSLFDQNVGIDQSKDARFKINIKIKSKISITPEWDINTISQAGFEWRERPYLEVGPIKIPIGKLIESAVNSKIKEINQRLDSEISRNVKIKSIIEKYWNEIQDPILVNETYSSYLQVIPESLALAPLSSDGKNITLNIGIKTQLNLMSGNKPIVEKIVPLPKLNTSPKNDSTFNLFFGGEITYTYATELAQKEFLQKTFEFENGKQKVTITDLQVFGNGDRLGMMIGVNGSTKQGIIRKKFKGQVFALGIPVYDAKTQTVYIRDFDFDMKSKDVLLNTAEWLFKGSLKKQIESRLNYSLKSDLEYSKKMAQDALTQTIIQQVKLNGKIQSLEPVGIYVGEKSLKVVMKATGNLSVRLQNF